MNCSERFSVRGLWFDCTNPVAVIARTYKHGNERGICAYCMLRLDKEDDTNFFGRHEFKAVSKEADDEWFDVEEIS